MNDRIQEIERLLERATGGDNWNLDKTGDFWHVTDSRNNRSICRIHNFSDLDGKPKAEFIAASKTIVRELIGMVRAYREVAIQNSYQGVNISDESVCQLIDSEAARIVGKMKEEK